MTADSRDCVLLPTNRRTIRIPWGKNAPGRSNIFYFLDKNGNPKFKNEKTRIPGWVESCLTFIRNYNGPNLIKNADAELDEDIALLLENSGRSGGRGFIINKDDRKLIENYAMNKAMRYFGRRATNVSKTESYDIHMNMGDHQCFIEVKGTQTDGTEVILTKNEVALLKRVLKRGHDTVLFVMHSILLKGRGNKRRASGGKQRIIRPFDVDRVRLVPLSYKCTLDDDL